MLVLDLHQPVQDLDEILTVEGGPSRGVQRGLQAVLHLAQQLFPYEGGVERQDIRALTRDRGDEPFSGQLGVGPRGGDDADPQITSEGPYRRQDTALGQLPRENRRADLLFDLLVERHASIVGQHDPHEGLRSSLYMDTIYSEDGSDTRAFVPGGPVSSEGAAGVQRCRWR